MQGGIRMIKVPTEILRFFDRKGGHSLLVKGEAGTGKTIFSLSLMKALSERGSGIYLSTRVIPGEIYRDCPWIEENLRRENIIDATNPKMSGVSFEAELKFSSKEDFLKVVYDKTVKEKNAFVVIDSWDAVLKTLSRESSEDIEKILKEFSVRTGTNIILVAEAFGRIPLDYSVDGVVELDREPLDGRMTRRLKIHKLRGIHIEKPEYLFTLNEGMFQSFGVFDVQKSTDPVPLSVRMDTETHFTSGNALLDATFSGGFSKGSCVLIEVDKAVESKVILSLTFLLASTFLARERGVIMLPLSGQGSRQIKEFIFTHVGKDAYTNYYREIFDEYLRIFEKEIPEAQKEKYSVALGFTDIKEDLTKWNSLLAEMKETTGKPLLSILGYDTLEYMYGIENLSGVPETMVSMIRSHSDLTVAGSRSDLKITPILSNMADYHLKIAQTLGTALLYCIKPYSGIYALEIDPGFQLKLTPFV